MTIWIGALIVGLLIAVLVMLFTISQQLQGLGQVLTTLRFEFRRAAGFEDGEAFVDKLEQIGLYDPKRGGR